MTIAVDSFGPVTDNAQSVYELSRIESLPNIGAEIEKEENKKFEEEGKPTRSEPEAFLTMPTSCSSEPAPLRVPGTSADPMLPRSAVTDAIDRNQHDRASQRAVRRLPHRPMPG